MQRAPLFRFQTSAARDADRRGRASSSLKSLPPAALTKQQTSTHKYTQLCLQPRNTETRAQISLVNTTKSNLRSCNSRKFTRLWWSESRFPPPSLVALVSISVSFVHREPRMNNLRAEQAQKTKISSRFEAFVQFSLLRWKSGRKTRSSHRDHNAEFRFHRAGVTVLRDLGTHTLKASEYQVHQQNPDLRPPGTAG